MEEWFKDWFDADYADLYAHRDATEAATAVATLLRAAPGFSEGPVLDLGCGTGRHLAELRKVNAQAFGLDLSTHLLGLAPAPLRGWLLQGDMRRLPVRAGTLSGVCLWFTPFGYFSDAENRSLLAQLGRLLKVGGMLLLDFMNAEHLKAHLVKEDVLERNGLRVLSRRSLEGGRIVKRMTITRPGTAAPSRDALESVRLYEPSELVAMTGACGQELVRELGDYGGSGFSGTQSPRWIGLFKQKSIADR
ncbi:MAG TPA: class I SAM-dependent methyltransferase [Holophaga sp.]|nr:class I SAM-dependent methyltransferase [Holophaga sp.]